MPEVAEARAFLNQWRGEWVICVASGPSLALEDCQMALDSGHRIIAVNNSWQLVPSCDVVYASDYAWWKRYASELSVPVDRWWTNNSKAAYEFRAHRWINNNGYNSGLSAIHLAFWFGAARVLLIGFDCKAANGELHWHGEHKRCLNPNTLSFQMWLRQYQRTAPSMRARVVNCSRDTAIKVFPRLALAHALTNELPHTSQG